MIVLGLSNDRVCALFGVGLLMLSACAREHEETGAGPSDPHAIHNEDDASGSGGTGASSGAAGQGGRGEQPDEQLIGGTSAPATADASVVTDPGETPSTAAEGAEDGGAAMTSVDAGEPHASFVGCRGPNDPGCAECKAQDGSSYSSASDGADWYNVSSIEGSCEPDCPSCAPCTYRNEADAIELGQRQECEPCEDPGVDPCFDPTSCGCYCQRTGWLSERCPTLF